MALSIDSAMAVSASVFTIMPASAMVVAHRLVHAHPRVITGRAARGFARSTTGRLARAHAQQRQRIPWRVVL